MPWTHDEMKERPILFSAPMVRALLAGTKTQTRRTLSVQPIGVPSAGQASLTRSMSKPVFYAMWDEPAADGSTCCICLYGIPGDRLRVKEAAWMWCERRPNGKTPAGRDKWLYVPMREAGLFYAADHPQRPAISVVSPDTGNRWGWRLKIGRFLPAWASRILLEVTGVRVERLQDISEADAIAEGVHSDVGCRQDDDAAGFHRIGAVRGDSFPIARYAALWESINGPGSWDANPWVWVVSFRRLPA